MAPDRSQGGVTTDGSHGPAGDHNLTLPAPSRSTVLAFGDYDVIGELGEGGMGRVYKAVDRNLGRFVAVKVLRSTDPSECGRFRGEAGLIAHLEHPNIIQVFAVDVAPDGRPYIVLELAEGGSLDRELDGRPLEPRRAAEMVETLARAVQYAHEKNVIHRDLKPANILRSKDRTLKLTDFGLAKNLAVASGMTPSNAVMGTPSYMSPEQAEGKVKDIGPAADVYGLGAILYEMLTGRPPFRGVNVVETLEQVRWAEPVPPTRLALRLPRDLSTICLKCLQKSPSRRYPTAGELADDLRAWLEGRTIAARPAPTWERLWRQAKRRPWEAATLVASGLLVALLIAGWVFMERKAAADKVRDEKEMTERRIRHEQEEADRKLREEKEKTEKEKHAVQRANEERLARQARASLTALNKIRGLVLEGDLSRRPGLDPLYAELSAFYNDLIAQEGLGFDKVELADGLVKIGDLFGRTGDRKKAREAYAGAAAHCRPLAGTDPKAREALASALLKGARVAFDQTENKAAEDCCDEAAALLAPSEPVPTGPVAQPRFAGQLAEAYHLRGQVLGRRGEYDKSEAAYQKSIAIRERLTAAEPANRVALADLGRGYGYLGDALLGANKVAEAETAYWKSHAIRERVVKAFRPGDQSDAALDAKCQLARSWGNFSALHTRSRALGTARYFAQQSLDAHNELVALDPINAEYKLSACNRLVEVTELEVASYTRPGAARDEHQRAEIARNLTKVKDLIESQPDGKDKQNRRAQGTLAAVSVLRALADVDSDKAKAKEELLRSYTAQEALCKPPGGARPEAAHLYYRALSSALLFEMSDTAPTPERVKQRVDALREALVHPEFNRLHPDDVAQFRAFRSLAGEPSFQAVLGEYRSKLGLKAVAAAP